MKFLVVLSVISLAFGQLPEQQPLGQSQAAGQMGESAPAANVESEADANARTQPQPQPQPQLVVINKKPGDSHDKVQAFVINRPQSQTGLGLGLNAQLPQTNLNAGLGLSPSVGVGLNLDSQLINANLGLGLQQQQLLQLNAQPIKVIEQVEVVKKPVIKEEIIIEEEPNKVMVSEVKHCEFRLPVTSFLQRKGVCMSIPKFFGCIGEGNLLAPSMSCGFAQACCIKISQ